MAHIFFIDPLEKLNIRKDSTLMMALTFHQQGIDSYLLFEKDFFISNDEDSVLRLYKFDGAFHPDGFYLENILQRGHADYSITEKDVIHMRIDPPYDSRYQRYLWMLDFIQEKTKCEVLNTPLKIMKYNEKLVAYKDLAHSHPSYIGSSESGFNKFIDRMKEQGHKEVILKPLDLYSGIGVEKVSVDNALEKFNLKVEEFHGAIVCQPFVKEVQSAGEYRAVYMDGEEIGTILKTPPEGAYLANIAQGAEFKAQDLPANVKAMCDQVAKDLFEDGVRLLAFDVLGNGINEVNITCPGLLVEVSYAYNKNLCELIARKFSLSSFAKEDQFQKDDILGFWLSENKKGVIEVYRNNDEFEGKLVWIKDIYTGKVEDRLDIHNPDKKKQKRSLLGIVNLEGFEFDGKEWMGGTIYDPEKGKTYKAFMRLADRDTLKLRGYIGISLFGRTTVWQRQKSAVPDSYIKKENP